MVRKIAALFASAFVLSGVCLNAAAVEQHVTVTVSEATAISVSKNVSITVPTPSAGAHPGVVFDSTSTYSISFISTHDGKITGSIDDPDFTDGLRQLSIRLDALAGSTSVGTVLLTASPQSLVTSIESDTFGTDTITYEFDPSNVSEGVYTAGVTLTLINE